MMEIVLGTTLFVLELRNKRFRAWEETQEESLKYLLYHLCFFLWANVEDIVPFTKDERLSIFQ